MKRTLIFIIATVIITLTTIATTSAEIPRLINYQGRLTDKTGKPLEGVHKLTFGIYDAKTAGTLLWEEIYDSTLQGARGVVIQKGIFNVLLGELNNGNGTYKNLKDLAFDKPYFLEIKVDKDEPLEPRQQIAAAGYAIRAERADWVGGVKGSENVIPSSGRIGVGNLEPQAMLDVSGEGTLKLAPRTTLPSSPKEGTIFYYANDKKLYLYTGSTGWKMLNTANISVTYPDEKRYAACAGGPCNLGTQVHFTWSNVFIPSIMNRLRVKYEWSSGNFADDYYSHNIRVLVNGNAIESFSTHQTDWVLRDTVYDVKSYLRYDGTDTVKIQLTDTSANEEDWYSFRNVDLEFL